MTRVSDLIAAFDQQLDAKTAQLGDEYAEGASDMVELLLPLLMRSRTERDDPAIDAAWRDEEARLTAEADRRPPEYNDGAIAACEAFLGLIDAIRAARRTRSA
ncbi:hypothetical protein [Frankia sp. AgB1.8]|uniref:hypothetical protein n=2 Tax=unclassified Frankia TaxID=2632575 RepID=UPI001931A536|nr:hypothetical protein [Frankia sp. AgB1.8]MBL7622058.1 hypothetical protein [Frankia sp. AgB1.8]